MPSRQSVEDLRDANASVVELITGTVEQFFRSLDLSSPEAARDALIAVVPALVEQYGEVAASVAADWYEAERAEAGVRGPYTATMAQTTDPDVTEQMIRRTAEHLFTDNPLAMLGPLALSAGKYAVEPSRSTIVLNARNERVRWARVPTGVVNCAFCLTMASRGFVYLSPERAGLYDKYHPKCDCVPTPDWSDSPQLEGYEPDELYSRYYEAREVSGSGDLRDILATLRQIDPSLH